MPRRCRRFKEKTREEQKRAIARCRESGGTWSFSYCMCKKKKQVGIGANVKTAESASESVKYRGLVYVLVESSVKLKSSERYEAGEGVISTVPIVSNFRESEVAEGTRGEVFSVRKNGGVIVKFDGFDKEIVVTPDEVRHFRKGRK